MNKQNKMKTFMILLVFGEIQFVSIHLQRYKFRVDNSQSDLLKMFCSRNDEFEKTLECDPWLEKSLTEQSLTGRSSLGKLIKWMHFFVKKYMSFICGQHLVWKFQRKNLYSHVKAVFRVFHRFLRNSLRGPKKCQKTQ